MCDNCQTSIRLSPWYAVTSYTHAAIKLKQDDDLPDYIKSLAAGTVDYEEKIRQAWINLKHNPTEANAKAFAELMKLISTELWEGVLLEVLGVPELSVAQQELLEEQIETHHSYIETSLLPDIIKAIRDDKLSLDSLDYRTTFLYAGALWAFGNLATVMFDGLSLRDLADLFIFVGPNDEATCTGERGCAQYANNIYTVAQILADRIIPGHLRCYTNCRHMLLPVASPLAEKKKSWNGKGLSLGELWTEKHLPGRHDQQRHAPRAYIGGTPVTNWKQVSGLLESVDSQELKNMIAGALMRYGVTLEELEDLQGFTSDAPPGYELNKRGYYAWSAEEEDDVDVLGVYSPTAKMIHIPEITAYRSDGPKIVLHEVGHHVTNVNPEAWRKKRSAHSAIQHLMFKKNVTDSELIDYGLRPYSLTKPSEFLADSYKVLKAGNEVQRKNLDELYQGMGFRDTSDVFKEMVLVDELQTRYNGDFIEIVAVPAEVPSQALDMTPWYYAGDQERLKHLPGKHDQQLHNPYKGRSVSDIDALISSEVVASEYSLMVDVGKAMLDAKMGATQEHGTTKELFSRLGYDTKPDVVTSDELDVLIESGDQEMFRVEAGGLAEEYADQFRTGDLHVGSGFYANGTHAAHGDNARAHALHFVKHSPEGGVMMRMALDKSSKVITESDLKTALGDYRARTRKVGEDLSNRILEAYDAGDKGAVRAAVDSSTSYARQTMALDQYYSQDMSRFAAAMGYDAIQGIDGLGGPETIILNRGKVHVSDVDEVVTSRSKHLPGRHDQQRHAGTRGTPRGLPGGLSDHVAEAFDRLLGRQPDVKSYTVLSQEDFSERYGSEFSNLIGETAAVHTDEGEIFVAEGNESFGVHELVHASGFMNNGVGTYVNEGVTQAVTEDIAKLAGVEVATTYQKEVEHVRKYLMPATGLSKEDFYRGYAGAEDKGKFLSESIWAAHGDKFSNAEDWGTDPKEGIHSSVPWSVGTGYDPYLYYLVDELKVTEKHLPGRHDQQRHAGTRGSGGVDSQTKAIIDHVRHELEDWALTPEREALLDAFEEEFPKALEAGGYSGDQVKELWVFGSYLSDKSVPGDLDMVALLPKDSKLINLATGKSIEVEGLFEMSTWPQHENKAPVAFVRDAEFLGTLLEVFHDEAPDNYAAPLRVYP